jgi:hypothetical protein
VHFNVLFAIPVARGKWLNVNASKNQSPRDSFPEASVNRNLVPVPVVLACRQFLKSLGASSRLHKVGRVCQMSSRRGTTN